MGRLSRREALGITGAALAAALVGRYLPQGYERGKDGQGEIKEKRSLERKAIIIGGGFDENSNYATFFADLYLWYYLAHEVLAIPENDITVLYHDGRLPQNIQAWLSKKLSGNPLAELNETLRRFPVEALPINGNTRKETILKEITVAAQTSHLDQLLIFRSGHGFLRWLGDGDNREIRSTMLLPEDKELDNVELANALAGNRAGEVITFLNQCYATFTLDMVETVPNLSVFTASGGSGVDVTWTDLRVDFQWPWTKAMQGAIFDPAGSDTRNDGRVCLADLQESILTNDSMATKGFYTEAYGQIKTHPGFAHGAMIDPHRTALLQYK